MAPRDAVAAGGGRLERLGTLRRKVREHLESLREGGKKTRTWSAPITDESAMLGQPRAKVDRARELANQKTGMKLSNAQFFRLMIISFLLDNEKRWMEGRERQMPDTNERPEERGIPEAVKRAIWDRSDGVCEFGSCMEPYHEYCHLKPHAEGSGREVEDLVHGCRIHHKIYDGGLIRFLAWTGDGRPVFYDDQRREMLPPKPPPGERDTAPMPPWLLQGLSKRLQRKYARLKKKWDAKRKAEEGLEPPKAPKPPGPSELPKPPPGTGLVRDRPAPHRTSPGLPFVSDTNGRIRGGAGGSARRSLPHGRG